ncbi:MAG: hypothetical protein J5806_00780 [Lentisphaeria bacterium]|nr:hypothetical protein [Lentisphaeria bacterium]
MTVILCIYAIGFLLWAGLLWFDSWMQIPFFLLLLGGLVFAIYRAVRNFRREKSWRSRLTSLIPLAIVLAATAMLALPLTDWKVRVDHCLFQKQRLQTVVKILRENPRIEKGGTRFKLPHWWLSCDGTAKVFCRGDNFLVEFPVTSGLLSGSWSVVYTERDTPPTAEDLLCGEVKIQEKLSPHWYYLHLD